MTEPQPPYEPPPLYGDQPLPPPANPYGPPPSNFGPPPAYGAPPPPYGAPPPPYGAPPQYPGNNPYPQPGAPFGVDAYGRPLSDKSKMLAGLLQLFLGTFGIGRFYLGYTGLGVAMLLLSWLTCGIWPLVDAILILVGKVPDSDGRTLRE
ncbi:MULTISPECIES: TM2 domain-containing protein [unclassified Mycobacterium]|uniref:TM2 domain-containing protein n=1 Tax=unclassified Mycobacterium TaxID=2642494 RepID=UPI0029C86793|nr:MULTISPECIES: TM2 domain-containing protein [unclassified Mycobacterium]